MRIILALMFGALLFGLMIPQSAFVDGQSQSADRTMTDVTTSSHGVALSFHIALVPGQETPPVTGVTSSGKIEGRLIDSASALKFTLIVCNISNATMADLHVGAFGKPGPVILFLYHMHEPLYSSTMGCNLLSSGTLNASDLIPNAANGINTWTDFITAILSGRIYANVHTSSHPAGEIRGQLVLKHTTPGFSLQTTFRGLGLPQGSSDNTMEVNVTSINGFSGNVSLTTAVSPVAMNGPAVAFYLPTVAVPIGGFASTPVVTSTMPNTPLGNYTVTITGQSGSLSSMTTFFVIVSAPYQPPDYNITANPLTVTAHLTRTVQWVNSTLTLVSLNGFSGTVSLSVISDPGPAVLVTPSTVTLVSGQTAQATLSLQPYYPGNYTVTVIAGGPGLYEHSVTVHFNIQPLATNIAVTG